MPTEPRLPFDEPTPAERLVARDEAARALAVDPTRNVVLEASAGTGKTHVLVTRYINLLRAGVDPSHILAITFTRKAAAEMRERIVHDLRELARLSPAEEARWRALRDRLGDIAISTIDAFCFSLLREFPLEADLDPGFDIADESAMPRLVEEALDGTLRAARRIAATDQDVELLLAVLGERGTRAGVSSLLDRRLSAGPRLRRFLGGAQAPSAAGALSRLVARMQGALASVDGGIEGLVADGPIEDEGHGLLAADLRALAAGFPSLAALERLARCFLTDKDTPRSRPASRKDQHASPQAWTRYSRAIMTLSPHVAEAFAEFERNLNVALVRAVGRLFRIARARYRRALETQSSVDFPEGLTRALRLLRQMDEFAQSRYRLEARYHHVLVDEFQDTNAPQWRLVARLIESWGEGMGLAHDGPLQPSIFVVGDRKQSIYGFRDADVRILRRAGRYVSALRPGGRARRSIARSFRAAPELLAFTNDLFASMEQSAERADAFRFTERDRFPISGQPGGWPLRGVGAVPALSLFASGTTASAADEIAAEIDHLLASAIVTDRETRLPRPARPGDIAILFRSRDSHREIEAALELRGIPTYVYKGLGFFEADEVKDLLAVLRYLANPASPLRAAALLRSRFVRLSDPAVRLLGPRLAGVLSGLDEVPSGLDEEDRRVLDLLRASLGRWLPLVDRLPPAEVLDRVMDEAAFAFELRGARLAQARENLKKVRAMARRLQNRGYATMARVAEHLDRLSAGDESNAVVDALDSVNLMTVHAAKGLEFPIVFITHLTRGTGGRGEPIVMASGGRGTPLVSVAGRLPEADEAVRLRDREETKRLLYVAVTRARERLYLCAVLRNGRFAAAPGSLGEVLPASLRQLFVGDAGPSPSSEPPASRPAGTGAGQPARLRSCSGGSAVAGQRRRGWPLRGVGAEAPASVPVRSDVEWRAESGGVHRVALASGAQAPRQAQPSPSRATPAGDDDRVPIAPAPADFGPLIDLVGQARLGAAAYAMSLEGQPGGWPLRGVEAEALADPSSSSEPPADPSSSSEPPADPSSSSEPPASRPAGTVRGAEGAEDSAALVGTIVHRLFEATRDVPQADEAWLAARARALLQDRDDGSAVDDAIVSDAVASFLSLRGRPEIAEVIRGSFCHYEVPFSIRLPGVPSCSDERREAVVIRGSIDCVAMLRDGRVVVLEFKTGRPQPWHDAQLDIYVRAARRFFPEAPVEGRLIYAGPPDRNRCNRQPDPSV